MRILSGIQPSGAIHLGNYLGALKNWVASQSSESFYSVVDLHSLTLDIDPAELKRKGVEGFVEVGFVVDENGLVQNVRVISSSQREFEQAAMTAVGKWKFKPGRKGGKNVPTNMAVNINFHLSGNNK